MVDVFCGTWKCKTTENFAEYMVALGAPKQIIKNASSTDPLTFFIKEGDKCIVKIEHGPPTNTNTQVVFKLGEEFDEHTSDGRRCKSVVHMIEGSMVYTQKWDGGKESKAVRHIKDDKLVLELSCGGVTAKRIYEKA